MRCPALIRLILPLVCGLSAVLACLPAAAQNRAIMQVSVTVVNTCQFGAVNSCALPGTRIVAASPITVPGKAPVKADGGAAAQPLQVLHL